MNMDSDPSVPPKPEVDPSRIARAGAWLKQVSHDTRVQLSTADLSPNEAKLRRSVAPKKFLPKIPDHSPIHDDTL